MTLAQYQEIYDRLIKIFQERPRDDWKKLIVLSKQWPQHSKGVFDRCGAAPRAVHRINTDAHCSAAICKRCATSRWPSPAAAPVPSLCTSAPPGSCCLPQSPTNTNTNTPTACNHQGKHPILPCPRVRELGDQETDVDRKMTLRRLFRSLTSVRGAHAVQGACTQ